MHLLQNTKREMEALQQFGIHTRQRKATLTELGRKWLVLNTALEPQASYALVASDWHLLKTRTHSPSLEAAYLNHQQRNVDPATFVWITKNGYAHTKPLSEEEQKKWPHLAQMCETLWPAPVDQEAWQPWQRTDHWKDRAYFLATMGCRASPQFYGLVEAIYREDSTGPVGLVGDAVSDLYTKLQRYGAESHHWPTPHELGSLAATLDLSHIQGGEDCVRARQEYLESKEAAAAAAIEATIESPAAIDLIQEPIILAQKVLPTPVGTEVTFEELNEFRRRNLIPPTFDMRKVAKQVVLSALGAPIPTEFLSASQRRNPDAPVQFDRATDYHLQTIQTLLNSVEHKQVVRHLDLVSPALQTHYWAQPNPPTTTAHEFVASLVHVYANPNGPVEAATYRKFHPKPDSSLIKTIVEL